MSEIGIFLCEHYIKAKVKKSLSSNQFFIEFFHQKWSRIKSFELNTVLSYVCEFC
jgi:hypothetical protein